MKQVYELSHFDNYVDRLREAKNRHDIERIVNEAKNDLGLTDDDFNIREMDIKINQVEMNPKYLTAYNLLFHLEELALIKFELEKQ